jgi:Domain of unknown function (DUF4394)
MAKAIPPFAHLFHSIKLFSMKNLQKASLKIFGLAVSLTAILGVFSCRVTPTDAPQYDTDIVALTDNNTLLKINASDPSQTNKRVAITGLAADEKVLAIDFRPATGQLYGVSSASKIYVIQPDSGTARAIGATAFTPAINGTIVGLDFNPTVDRIRLTTNTGQNLRLNPETGATAATDAALNPSTPSVSEVAYTNNSAGVTTTTLYDIDVTTDKLYMQNPPNNGTLVEVGDLGVNAEGAAGFDITDNNLAYSILKVDGKSRLYVINLATGRVLNVGNTEIGANIIGLSVPTAPVAYAVDATNNLLIFNPFDPQPIAKPITGLMADETVLGLDMRPANGQLYALGSSSRLYTINASSGAATAVGTAAFTPLLSGTAFGFDFNPTVDRIRIVSNTGQNLRAHPETGVIAAVDGAINPTGSVITAAAYTNNFAGATSTTLYVIDAQNKRLFIQNPPNNGTLTPVGIPFNVTFADANGFDISSKGNRAFVLLNNAGETRLYDLNLTTAVLSKGVAFPRANINGFALGLGF